MSRIEALRLYLLNVLDTLTTNEHYINANMLEKEIENYSLDKLPTQSVVRSWIDGTKVKRDVYSFRSRKTYSQDTMNNLKNIGFFEDFEEIIESNNRRGILPNIDGIISIECLNCGSLTRADTNEAIFNIQIQITYMMEVKDEDNSEEGLLVSR